MSQRIIINWGDAPLRLIAINVRDQQVTLTRLATLPTASRRDPVELIETLKAWRVAKAQVVVVVDRADCEVRGFQVPPVPAEELPAIVRFQALQHFASLEDGSAIDYLPTPEGGGQQVLAAALPAERMEEIEKLCGTLGAHLLGVIFQPCGIAAVVEHALRSLDNTAKTRLIIAEADGKVDLTLTHGPLVLMSRSVRLITPDATGNEGVTAASRSTFAANREFILNEVKRTLAAARVQSATRNVEALVICGALPDHQRLANDCQRLFDLPAQSIDIATDWQRTADAADVDGTEVARYAYLVGAALLEVHSDWPGIDFLRPRQAPQPRDRRQLWTTIAALGLAVGFLCGLVIWWGLATRDAEILSLRKRNTEMDQLVEVANRQRRDLEGLEEWFANSPNWLYELRELSRRLPGSDKMRLRRLQADITNTGGRITLQGVVDRAETVTQLEDDLRDERHRIEGVERNLTGEDSLHPWYFVERIDVSAAATEEMVKRLNSEALPATRSASTTQDPSSSQMPQQPEVPPRVPAAETAR